MTVYLVSRFLLGFARFSTSFPCFQTGTKPLMQSADMGFYLARIFSVQQSHDEEQAFEKRRGASRLIDT